MCFIQHFNSQILEKCCHSRMSLNYPKMKKIFFLLDKASLCRNYKLLNSICRFSTTPKIRYEGVRESRLKQRNLEETNSDYVSYEIIGNGSIDGLKSVLLSTPRQSYLFNCGECTQRKIQGRRTQGIIATASSISNVFITKPTWNNIGGLFGKYVVIYRKHIFVCGMIIFGFNS